MAAVAPFDKNTCWHGIRWIRWSPRQRCSTGSLPPLFNEEAPE
ncbi:hypothetical protein OH492_20900 [Vibrio chagasii]|nr:hypothetical protein [Vibrio chagasii]